MDPAALAPVLEGHDVVLSALGPAGNGPTTVCADGARAIAIAMPKAGLSRLLVISAAGISSDGDEPFTRFVVKPILNRIFRHPFNDTRAMEREIGDSGLDWTFIRPPRLTDGAFTGRYRSNANGPIRRGFRISRADLAHAMLDAAADATTVRTTLSVAS